jgi:hypothetical protein
MKKAWYLLFCASMVSTSMLVSRERGIHRPIDPALPEVRTRWLDSSQEYSLRSYAWEESTLFKLFDYDNFMQNLLPSGPITLRNDSQSIQGDELHNVITDCLHELQKTRACKKKFTTCTVLKKNNFNFKKSQGLIVIRPKQEPYDRFVVKLFIETPESFVRHFRKDLEQNCLFRMAGGISRYLVGFTRLKNLAFMRRKIADHPYWSNTFDLIRKWFWMPTDNRWFRVTAFKVAGKDEQSIDLPGIYAVIGDFVKAKRVFALSHAQDRDTVLSWAAYCEENVDPNITNYVEEEGTGKYVPLDSEHFPSSIGLRKPLGYTSYSSWYFKVFKKYIKDNYFCSRNEHRAIQASRIPPIKACQE